MYAPFYLICAGTPNTYQQAIAAVGAVLEPYDTDKLYPVYGFGAKLKDPSTGKYSPVQHCFPVYAGGLEVQGVAGILQVVDWVCCGCCVTWQCRNISTVVAILLSMCHLELFKLCPAVCNT